ncbi:HEAT repeat domain-containing protein [Stutzerimonas nitrititolerans]|uniref:HEAT repeat domain-containing protein n=1 Tax=Stutzerimonas nitrititolerans TaxID=2482751 RepID=A0ABX9V9E1_9GAMM|nr:HEAT repeat domain-containing protein [Stutzerimonas nitrititolerans]RMI02203.1 HEAT repeat domain-containing protein [Stutzerimonas nitrititolerans]
MRSDWNLPCPDLLCETPMLVWAALKPQDVVLLLAFYCVVGLAALTLLVMVQVLLFGEAAKLQAKRRQRFNDSWRPYFALCSLSDELPEASVPSTRTQQLWLLLQWNRTQMQLRGAAHERMNRAMVALGMERLALALLRGRVRNRLIGLTSLRHLADARHWDAVMPMLQSRNTIVSLTAAQTLVAMDPARAMQAILATATKRPDWALPRLASLCLQAGEQAVTGPLLSLLNTEATPNQRLAALLVHSEPRHAAAWARTRLNEDAPVEHMLAALRCLGELGDPRDRTNLIDKLQHSHPGVRLESLQALGRQARSDDQGVFMPLLKDRTWSVRQAAADSLASLPGMTTEQLQQMLHEVDDRYGQDALRRAIAETQR